MARNISSVSPRSQTPLIGETLLAPESCIELGAYSGPSVPGSSKLAPAGTHAKSVYD